MSKDLYSVFLMGDRQSYRMILLDDGSLSKDVTLQRGEIEKLVKETTILREKYPGLISEGDIVHNNDILGAMKKNVEVYLTIRDIGEYHRGRI